MHDKPIKGVIAIAVDEKGNWMANGFPEDPEGRQATDCCLAMMADDDKSVGMVAVYLKPVEFWPAIRETLGDKPLFQDVKDIDVVAELDSVVENLLDDCEVQLDKKIAQTLDRLKSLLRLRVYVKGEVAYYENDANSSIKAVVQEAIELVGGEQQSLAIAAPPVVQRSVEHKIEHSRKETVTVRGSVKQDDDEPDDSHETKVVTVQSSWDDVSDDEIYEALASPLQMYTLLQKLNVPYRISDAAKAHLSASDRFIQRGSWWWRKEDHDAKYGVAKPAIEVEKSTTEDEPLVANESRTWDDITDDEIADFMTPKAKKGSEIANHFGCPRLGVDDRLRQSDRFVQSHVWWKLRPIEDDQPVSMHADAYGGRKMRYPPPGTPPARPADRKVEIKPCDKCGGPLGDGMRPFACPVCDVPKIAEQPVDATDDEPGGRSVDNADPSGRTSGQIESYVNQRLRQSKNGMMLIADIAEELGIGQAAVVEVVRSMSDVSHTGLRVIQKLVK